MDPSKGVRVLEEQEENRTPSEEEVLEYAAFLEIDVKKEPHLMWIAEEGVVAPVPSPWKMCTENDEDFFYFNFETGESVWDHPCDEKYREMVKEYREKALKEKSGDKSIESASKLDKSGDRSIESAASKLDEGPASLGKPSSLDISKDTSRDEVCKFEASALDSSMASPARPELDASKGSALADRSKRDSDEASEVSSSSSAASSVSGPGNGPKSARSEKGSDGAVSPVTSGSPLPIAQDSKPEGRPTAADGAAGTGAEPSTPPRGLLEASGADVVVDLTTDAASEASPGSSLASRGQSPILGASRGGDDAAGHASIRGAARTDAALHGWESLVGRAAEQAEERAGSKESQRASSKESKEAAASRQTSSRSQRAVAGWQKLAEPLVAEEEEEPPQEEKPAAGAPTPAATPAPVAAIAPPAGVPEDPPSEISEEYPSEFAGSSPAASRSGAPGRSSPAQSGTPEPPVSLAEPEEVPRTVGSGDEKPKLTSWAQVEAELASLSRCLTMLRDIREKQAKFLELLNG